ncbi:MAG: GTP-binding protein [Euryarchaeota archaeon]|nr:GTP-binding protein [Euryarchaeota archaeon]
MNFKQVPRIPSSEELVEYAFSRARRRHRLGRAQGRWASERRRIVLASASVRRWLNRILARMPEVESLPPFYRELIDVLVDAEKLSRSLRSLRWASKKIERIEGDCLRRLGRAESAEEARRIRREFYGRAASVVRSIDGELAYLRDAREKLKNLPTFREMFTAVIAGAPNVGKSSLLRQLTGAEPRIESYPFTTTSLLVGYMRHGFREVQLVDTPGLLDRKPEEMNRAERQCMLALRHLAELVVFVFDPSESCGYTLEQQLRIHEGIASSLGLRMLRVVNKADLLQEEVLERLREREPFREAVVCSARLGEGIEMLRSRILEYVN